MRIFIIIALIVGLFTIGPVATLCSLVVAGIIWSLITS